MIWLLSFFSYLILSLKSKNFLLSLLQLDSMVGFMICIIPLVSMLIFMLFNQFTLKKEKFLNLSLFFLIFLFMTLMFLSFDSFLFVLFLELTIFPMSILIFKFSKDSDKIQSLLFMLFMNLAGSIPFLYFCFYNHKMLLQMTEFMNFSVILFLDWMIFFLMNLILLCKLPVFLTHFWLTKAHVAASGTCSMILASLMLKIGSFGMLKFSTFMTIITKSFYSFILSFSLFSTILFYLIMMRFLDIKFLVACSSIVHMSFIFPFSLEISSLGVCSTLFMMVGHGLISYFLFFLVTSFYENTLNRSIELNKSMESYSSITMMYTFLFFFINMGFPPFVSFISETVFMGIFIMKSNISVAFLCLQMVLSVVVTMIFLTKLIFGKKIMFIHQNSSSFLNESSFIFLISILILPFLY